MEFVFSVACPRPMWWLWEWLGWRLSQLCQEGLAWSNGVLELRLLAVTTTHGKMPWCASSEGSLSNFSFFLFHWTGNHERNNDEGGSWLVRWMTMSSWGQSCEGWSGLVWQTESIININVPKQTFGKKFQFPDFIGLRKNYWTSSCIRLAKLYF
jgi:hypothetical protein